MPGTDLIPAAPKQQIRSYHRAFLGELTLYTFGGDLRPWRPIPARGVFWMAGIEVLVLAITHALGISMPFATAAWGLFYLVLPLSLAWLFTVTRIEGRRLHVAVVAWLRHAVLGNHLAGGYRRIPPRAAGFLAPSRIRLADSYVPPRPVPVRECAVAGVVVLALLAAVRGVVGDRDAVPSVVAAVNVAGSVFDPPLVVSAQGSPFPRVVAQPVRHPAPPRVVHHKRRHHRRSTRRA